VPPSVTVGGTGTVTADVVAVADTVAGVEDIEDETEDVDEEVDVDVEDTLIEVDETSTRDVPLPLHAPTASSSRAVNVRRTTVCGLTFSSLS